MIVQITDFCDPNDQEKQENFWMHKLRTLYPMDLTIEKLINELLTSLFSYQLILYSAINCFIILMTSEISSIESKILCL